MSASVHPISWFEQRLGKVISRNGRSFEIPNQASAKYCYELQESGFTFSDPKPKVTIHYAPETGCAACEG